MELNSVEFHDSNTLNEEMTDECLSQEMKPDLLIYLFIWVQSDLKTSDFSLSWWDVTPDERGSASSDRKQKGTDLLLRKWSRESSWTGPAGLSLVSGLDSAPSASFCTNRKKTSRAPTAAWQKQHYLWAATEDSGKYQPCLMWKAERSVGGSVWVLCVDNLGFPLPFKMIHLKMK